MTDYIVSFDVRFSTPLGVMGVKSESMAKVNAEAQLRQKLDKFFKTLNDIADVKVEVEYVEED